MSAHARVMFPMPGRFAERSATELSPEIHTPGAAPRSRREYWRGGTPRWGLVALLLAALVCPASAWSAQGAGPEKADGVVHLSRGEEAPVTAIDARRAYVFRVGTIIRSHWRLMTLKKAETGVQLRIDHQGLISDVRIVAPSGSSAVDESVSRAVRATRQVPPPPAGIDGTLRLDFIVP